MRCVQTIVLAASVWCSLLAASLTNAELVDTARGDRMLADYFRSETRQLAEACLADVKSWDDWVGQRVVYRRQLLEMLGLDPLPERTPLVPVVTGKLEHADFTVEKLHFQSQPGLYVTANLYVPKNLTGRAPAILYVCGHSQQKKDGISFGNKTGYQHHGAWFAQNGYVCLLIDTVQLGEIEGVHHGTYRQDMWWWNARGYTPAGVEAWNSMRALDYLESRPEVDAERMGVTGRSGGGAYSWFLAALDDRVKTTVPVAGITNLKNHVVDGCIEGHCDCMYFVNTYRWDYPQLAAMVAPRPLLIANTDRDNIFPLEGVLDVHEKTRRLYRLHGKPEDIGLQIAAGTHADIQVLQLHALQWFNQRLRGENPPITSAAEKLFEPEELKVFDTLPADAINARIHETFVPQAAAPDVPATASAWKTEREAWLKALREKCFAGWPEESQAKAEPPHARPVFDRTADNKRLVACDFDSQGGIELRLYVLLPADVPPNTLQGVVLHPLDAEGWTRFLAAMQVDFAEQFAVDSPPPADARPMQEWQTMLSAGQGLAFVAPRGIGRTAWNADPNEQRHVRRRFMLLGQTLDGMRVWDVRRATHVLPTIEGLAIVPVSLNAEGEMAGIALYAALFEPSIARLELRNLAPSHRSGPDFLNVLRILDVPQTVAMVAERSQVRIHDSDATAWDYPRAVAKLLWPRQLELLSASKQTGE